METDEIRDHVNLRRLAWIIVWILVGSFALVALSAVGSVVRNVAAGVLFDNGLFGPTAGFLRAGATLFVLAGAIAIPVVVLTRLVRARSLALSRNERVSFGDVISAPLLVLVALSVVVGAAVFRPSGPWPGTFYFGLLLLAAGIALLATDPRLVRAPIPGGPATGDGGRAFPIEPTERRPRHRSHLGALTIGALFILVAILGLLGSLGFSDFDARVFPALALTVLGAGLLLGAWVGKARWLTILCVLTLPFVVVANVIDVPFAGGIGSQYFDPHTVADVRSSYEVGIGKMTLNLTDLKSEIPDATVSATVAAGDLIVYLPQGLHVVVEGSVRAGRLEISGPRSGAYLASRSGFDLRATTEWGRQLPGLLHLVLHGGMGSVQVYVLGHFDAGNAAQNRSPQSKTSTGGGKP